MKPRTSTDPLNVARPKVAIVAFGMTPSVDVECMRVAGELGIAFVRATHLRAACKALDDHSACFFLVSDTVRPWDREVISDRARGKRVYLQLSVGGDLPVDLARAARLWMQKRS